MQFLRMSAKKIVVVLCIIMYSIIQVSTLKCYYCISTYKDECYTNPTQEKFELKCPYEKNISTNINKLTGGDISDVSSTSSSGICGTAIGTRKGEGVVLRGCVPKKASLEDIKKIAQVYGVTVKTWTRCDTDLCNYELPA